MAVIMKNAIFWKCGLQKMLENYQVATQVMAPRVALSYIELVITIIRTYLNYCRSR
jgi:hypothetical protein